MQTLYIVWETCDAYTKNSKRAVSYLLAMLKKLAGQNERIGEGEIGSGTEYQKKWYDHSECDCEF